MIFNAVKKITGIEKDANIKGAAGALKYAADISLYVAVFFYLAVVGIFLPLYLPGYDTLGTDKGQFWIGALKLSGIILTLPLALYILYVVIKVLTSGFGNRPVFYVTDIFAAFFILSVLVSYALSDEKQIALYGERGWFIGTISYFSVGIGVLVIPRLGKAKNYFCPVIMASSFAVCLIGVLMDYFGNVLNAEGWDTLRISTIGNSNWFCGYLMTVMFAGVAAFILRKEGKQRSDKGFAAIVTIYLLTAFYSMFSQGSASAYLALWAVLLALMILAGGELKFLRRIFALLIICMAGALAHAIYIMAGGVSRTNDLPGRMLEKPGFTAALLAVSLILYLITGALIKKGKRSVNFNPGIILTVLTVASTVIFILLIIANTVSGVGYLGKEGSVFWFDYDWGSSRGATISIGMEVFKGMNPLEKLFGKGPDNFYSFLMSGRVHETAEKCMNYFGGARLTNAHCEPLTMLVNTGIAGTASFYGLMICVMVKGFRKKTITALACSLGILAYIINNIFSFQTSVNVSQLALVLGFGAWAVIPDKSEG